MVSMMSMGIAGLIAYEGKPYWGWFLISSLIAIQASRSVDNSGNCCKKDKTDQN